MLIGGLRLSFGSSNPAPALFGVKLDYAVSKPRRATKLRCEGLESLELGTTL